MGPITKNGTEYCLCCDCKGCASKDSELAALKEKLEELERMADSAQCVYCGGIYKKDRGTIIEHISTCKESPINRFCDLTIAAAKFRMKPCAETAASIIVAMNALDEALGAVKVQECRGCGRHQVLPGDECPNCGVRG